MKKARWAVLTVGLLSSCQSLIGYEAKDFTGGEGEGDGDLGGQGGMKPGTGGTGGDGTGGDGSGGKGSGGQNFGGDPETGGSGSGGDGSGGDGSGGDGSGGDGSGGEGTGGDGSGGEGTGGEGTGGNMPAFLPNSCVDLPEECGDGSEPCCGVVPIAAGEGTRGRTGAGSNYEPPHAVTVSAFSIDQFEVTVGRFGRFVAAYEDWRTDGHPMAGAGAHPAVSDSGWRSEWDTELPQSLQPNECHVSWATYQHGTDIQPMNCLSWYEAYAFCIWDGGRLPTEAEWEYVASGQGRDRSLPWGGAPADAGVNASFDCFMSGSCNNPDKNVNDFVAVGSLPSGYGIGGVAEMAGNAGEWVRDTYAVAGYLDYLADGCTDCIRLVEDDTNGQRVLRGGNIVSPADEIRTYIRFPLDPSDHYPVAGVRCAYDE